LTSKSVLRYNYLDSSRGIAACIVLFSHFQLTVLPQWNDSILQKTPLHIFLDGTAAVLYFFLLSGFVLTLSLKNTNIISAVGYFKFAIKRIFRIYPAYIITLLITFFIIRNIDRIPTSWLSQYWQTKPEVFSVIRQSVLVIRLPNDPLERLIPHDWTLSIEMAASLLLPLLAFSSRNAPSIVLIFVYCAIQFLELDPFIFDFTIGVFIASSKEMLIKKFEKFSLKICGLIIGLALICSDYIFPEEMKNIDMIFIHHKTWGLAILFCLLLSSMRAKKILSSKILVFIGKSSYSFYLLHLVILLFLITIFKDLSPPVLLIIYLSITIIFSRITFQLIEEPFNRLGKKIVQRNDGKM
jgi:peptidoglycan/LPS O-acetylase OafA/YrhL